MKKKLKNIECNERMEVTSFFGFKVAPNAIEKKFFLDMADVNDFNKKGDFVLYENGKKVLYIEFFNHFYMMKLKGVKITEPLIWDHIRKEVRKYTRSNFIYVDKSYVEDSYSPLANIYYDEE